MAISRNNEQCTGAGPAGKFFAAIHLSRLTIDFNVLEQRWLRENGELIRNRITIYRHWRTTEALRHLERHWGRTCGHCYVTEDNLSCKEGMHFYFVKLQCTFNSHTTTRFTTMKQKESKVQRTFILGYTQLSHAVTGELIHASLLSSHGSAKGWIELQNA
jgi:hypothetical protein